VDWDQASRLRFPLATVRTYAHFIMALAPPYTPGSRVRVTQQMPRLSGPLTTTIEGTVMKYEQQKTGSWYAHAKDDKLWLDRLILRKDDGETVYLNLDQFSLVEILEQAPAA